MTTTNEARLGKSGPSVFPIALGCMGMGAGSWYGDSDEAESIATIHDAVGRGVNVLDTGDFYGMGRNELLVGKALKGRRDKVLLSVKFGALRGPDGEILGLDARPAATKNALAHSLSRLGVDYIDIYRAARLDPNVTIIPTICARTRKQLVDALSSLDVSLDASEIAALEAAVPASRVAGTRYPEAQMAILDSEK